MGGLLRSVFLCAAILLGTTACGVHYPGDKIDPAGNLTREDYKALRDRGKATAQTSEGYEAPHAPIPPLPALRKPVIPQTEEIPELLVSLSVTDSVPLRDVLIELGRKGKVNMEIDPQIVGGIIFSAYEQPFEMVLRRICDLGNLRYQKKGGFIRIERDEPYHENYELDYLSLARKTNSEISISTNVFDLDVGAGTAGGGQTRAGQNENNSTASIAAVAEADFWKNVEKNLPHILTKTTAQSAAKGPDATHSIDRQSGLVSVFGTSRQHRAVRNYLQQLYAKASAQVLIEARIVEVELNESFQSGINWSQLFDDSVSVAANFGSPGLGAAMTTATTGLFTTSINSGDFSSILNLVRTFGTTRVLSAPRLTVINNQTAVLKVARNEVYFITSAQFPTTINANGVPVSGSPVFSSTPRTVPVGLVMTVQPAINTEKGRITMTLRPTISRVIDRVADPSIGLNAANAGINNPVQSKVPVLAVREMDSVLQLQSGEVAVMGGLMQDSSESQDQGAPPFDTVPLVGDLAKSRDNRGRTSELVILLRATIMNTTPPDFADRDLYERYHNDPRPLPM